jgi:polar amino acid transport system substrate-binding protein
VTPTVLAAPEAIPQSYIVNGEQTGFLIDIVKEAFRRAGRPVEIRLLPWARCLSEARHGGVDGFFTAFMTPARQSVLGFSLEPLMTQTQSLFVRKGSPITFDGDLSKLGKVRLGLIYDTSYGPRLDRFLAQRPSTQTEQHDSLETVIKMLAGGRVDVLPGDRQSVIQTAASLGLSDQIVELSPTIETVPAYLVYTREWDMGPIIADIDKSLRSMKEDGFYDTKLRQYYPQ